MIFETKFCFGLQPFEVIESYVKLSKGRGLLPVLLKEANLCPQPLTHFNPATMERPTDRMRSCNSSANLRCPVS